MYARVRHYVCVNVRKSCIGMKQKSVIYVMDV